MVILLRLGCVILRQHASPFLSLLVPLYAVILHDAILYVNPFYVSVRPCLGLCSVLLSLSVSPPDLLRGSLVAVGCVFDSEAGSRRASGSCEVLRFSLRSLPFMNVVKPRDKVTLAHHRPPA